MAVTLDDRLCRRAIEIDDEVNALPEAERPAEQARRIALFDGSPAMQVQLAKQFRLPPPAHQPTWTTGMEVGEYRLETHLGSGGFGHVWSARKVTGHLNPLVALKLPHNVVGGLDAILREARLQQGAGKHQSVLMVIDAFSVGDQAVIVFELCLDGSLADLLERNGGQGLDVDVALAIVEDILDGLDHIHRHGVVHRDLKPANILMQMLRARLADFGLAGTMRYLPPEAFALLGSLLLQDLWAVGVILYEMLAGRHPYDAEVRTYRAPPPLPKKIPDVVQAIVTRALHEQPEKRYQSAEEMLAAVQSARRHIRPQSGPNAVATVWAEPSVPTELPMVKRRRWPVVVAVLAMGAGSFGAAVDWPESRRQLEATAYIVPEEPTIEPRDPLGTTRNRVVSVLNNAIDGCQARAVGHNGGMVGDLTVSFTVRTDGRVQDGRANAGDGGDPEVAHCAEVYAGRMHFDSAPWEATLVMVRYHLMRPAMAPRAPRRE